MRSSLRFIPTSLLWLLALVPCFGADSPGETPRPHPVAGLTGFAALSVKDAPAMADWYAANLGFRRAKEIVAPDRSAHIILLQNGEASLELLQHQAARPLATVMPEGTSSFRVHGIFKAGFLARDLDAVLRALRERQVEPRHGPFHTPELELRSFILADPEGNLIQMLGR